jgi:uncharacterized alpha-E superfamily protein
MLSRVADALFWMSRYLERAEHIARLLDVCFHLELDLHGVLAGPHELQWTSMAAILQQAPPPSSNGASPQAVISRWLAFDLTNPSSILSCINRARDNARRIRGTITSEMWKELNKLYWKLRDEEFVSQAHGSPHDFYEAVESGSHLFQGVCDATLTHDEGWQFIQLGKFLERADKTLRILDNKYHLLHEVTNPADLPLCHLQWAGVLRCCRAYEAYQRLYVGRVEPERVVEFLLLHRDFPRSARFCLEEAARALAEIEGPAVGRADGRAERILGRVLSDLKFAEPKQVLHGDLHGFLGNVLKCCGQVTLAVQEQYALH